jgi:hypothetical protein
VKIYQYAVILHPSEKEKKDGKKSELIVDLRSVLAADDKAAMVLAARAIPEEYIAKLDRIEVAIRPF